MTMKLNGIMSSNLNFSGDTLQSNKRLACFGLDNPKTDVIVLNRAKQQPNESKKNGESFSLKDKTGEEKHFWNLLANTAKIMLFMDEESKLQDGDYIDCDDFDDDEKESFLDRSILSFLDKIDEAEDYCKLSDKEIPEEDETDDFDEDIEIRKIDKNDVCLYKLGLYNTNCNELHESGLIPNKKPVIVYLPDRIESKDAVDDSEEKTLLAKKLLRKGKRNKYDDVFLPDGSKVFYGNFDEKNMPAKITIKDSCGRTTRIYELIDGLRNYKVTDFKPDLTVERKIMFNTMYEYTESKPNN